MKFSKDPLVLAVDRLEVMLARNGGADPQQGGRIDQALANVEQAIRQHAERSGPVGEPVANLDRPLLPSPGGVRKQAELRNELGGLLHETRSLRHALQAPQTVPVLAPDAVCGSGSKPVQACDFKPFFTRARQLAESLETFGKDEVNFVQESVTTDIGAGD